MKIYQIYFKPEQFQELSYEGYLNNNCTVFFENSVIRDLVNSGAHHGQDYFGVVSYKLKHKIDLTKRWKILNISNASGNVFTPESFQRELYIHNPDAMSFQRHLSHDPVSFADQFHPNFSKYFKHIMGKIGYTWVPTHIRDVFYCNYFVAKSDLYNKYVKEMLSPAMDVMATMPELMGNSHYPHPLPEHLKQSFGISHYPYHPFICERMFSFFSHLNKLKCLHY